MKIPYGVCGEGMGHAVRSVVVGQHLKERGHEVTFLAGKGRAYDHLVASGVGRVIPGVGLATTMVGNTVDYLGTIVGNAFRSLRAPFAMAALSSLPKPDVVLSDFEPWSARYAGTGRIPLIALDNIHFASRCSHPPEAFRPHDRLAAIMMNDVLEHMVPNATHYMVTAIGKAPVTAPRTTLHAPILRHEVLSMERRAGSHVVVYFNDTAQKGKLFETLGKVGADFRVYGLKGEKPGYPKPNVEVARFGDGFLHDLAGARAVIGGAGFTLMSEAVHLGKPFLAVPFGNQGEQILNSNYVGLWGFGERAASPVTAPDIERFLARAPAYTLTLGRVKHDDNEELFASLDRLLERRGR
jgi:uncharacterized protein (TIGR00661 family)